MPFTSEQEGFDRQDIIPSDVNRHPKILDDITQVLSRLMGWYDAGKIWKKINVDSQGRLLVSANAGQINTGTVSTVTIGVAAGSVLAANINRRTWVMKNNGATNIFFAFDNTVTTLTGFPLYPGEFYTDDVYVGAIFAIGDNPSGQLKVIEY